MEIVEPYKKPFWKAISWRIIASLITMGLVYLATGSFVLTLLVGIPETILKIIFYILHEMVWERWG
jgi:uncharacterized membrane protein